MDWMEDMLKKYEDAIKKLKQFGSIIFTNATNRYDELEKIKKPPYWDPANDIVDNEKIQELTKIKTCNDILKKIASIIISSPISESSADNSLFSECFCAFSEFFVESDNKRALECLNKALQFKKDPLAYSLRGTLQFRQLNNISQALKDFDEVIRLNPSNCDDAYLNQGIIYRSLGNYPKAEELFTKIPSISYYYINGIINLGINYADQYKLYNEKTYKDSAIKQFDHAIDETSKFSVLDYELKKGMALAYAEKAELFFYDYEYDECISVCENSLYYDRNRSYTYILLGYIQISQQDYKNAIKNFEISINIIEKYENEKEKENKEKIIELYRKLIKACKYHLKYITPKNEIDSLMQKINAGGINSIERIILQNKNEHDGFLTPGVKNEPPEIPEMYILRRWNSFSPILANEDQKGGGYFIRTAHHGLIIDPGFDFIENFKNFEDCKGKKLSFNLIDKVLITHAHNDHTADIESLLTLLSKYNSHIVERSGGKIIDGLLKTIDFYMSISTYKKYVSIFNLFSKERDNKKNYYTITIVKDKDIIPFKDINIEIIRAKHDDLQSDRDSLGFIIYDNANNLALLHTGDTGFDSKTGKYYKDIQNKLKKKNNEIVLLANIGGFKENEQFYCLDNYDNDTAFYPNHLGRLGLAKLIEILNPNICIITEFGEEFFGCRKKLCDIYYETYKDTKKTLFFPADIGFIMNFKLEILCDGSYIASPSVGYTEDKAKIKYFKI